jgi:sigma-B regulation protein RsbQ
MGALERNNVQVIGSGSSTLVFAHGFGCDQTMWRVLAPGFAERFAPHACAEAITEFVRGFET